MTDDVARKITLAPDPGLVKSLGTNHSLPTAMADLVDNSVDAKASRVLIRFLRDGPRLEQIHVLDDGAGMDSSAADRAMTLGGRRDYEARALGHFGLGLKAAALSTGDVLTVFSQTAGATPVGRRLVRQDMARDYSCDVLTTDGAALAERDRAALIGGESGTSVRLSSLHLGRATGSDADAAAWMHSTLHGIRVHLGIVFHRLLADARVRIELEEGMLDGARGATMPVAAIDPFGYRSSGRPGYPRELISHVDGHPVHVTCHVWPPKSTADEFRLGNRNGGDAQGFYVYRGDRLLSWGTWCDVTPTADELGLGRVALEYDEISDHVRMNPEKSSIGFDADLAVALRSAHDDHGDFERYLTDLRETYTVSRQRKRQRKPSVSPDKGFTPRLREAIGRELEYDEMNGPMSVRWRRLPRGVFFDVDLPNRQLWLNNLYREAVTGGGPSGLNDAPLVKALLYLLMREVYLGQYLGARDKDDIALWQAVLGSAADEELAKWERDRD